MKEGIFVAGSIILNSNNLIVSVMKQTFNYRDKFAVSYCYPALAFIALAVICEVFTYGIAFKRFTLLAYPNSVYVMGAVAVLCLIYAFAKYSKAAKSKKNPNQLEVGDTEISFPKGAEEKITVPYSAVTEVSHGEREDDGKVLVLRTENGSYEFKEDKFDNAQEFAAFVGAFDKKFSDKK